VNAREEVLARVRAALGEQRGDGTGDGPGNGAAPSPAQTHHGHRRADGREPGHPELLDLLVDRLEDYKATVHRCSPDQVGEVVARVLAARGSTSLVAPAGVPHEWTDLLEQTQTALRHDQPDPLPVTALDATDSVLTGCAVAIADTGTIVLDAGPDQGRRALTLVPDHHVCVVRADQVVGLVPEAVARLDPTRPLTWISGPSATSDIELNRVEGVHGPRTLEVVLVG
jgi:L-lactate dehydrogenase complex protein LldG